MVAGHRHEDDRVAFPRRCTCSESTTMAAVVIILRHVPDPIIYQVLPSLGIPFSS
jgi:hypothetical protein